MGGLWTLARYLSNLCVESEQHSQMAAHNGGLVVPLEIATKKMDAVIRLIILCRRTENSVLN